MKLNLTKKSLLVGALVTSSISFNGFGQARVQAIHNSPDVATDTVDVWATSGASSSLLIDDFAFRNATPFINVTPGVPITLSFAPKNSTAITDTIAGLSTTVTLTNGATYIIVANGTVSSGYTPAQPFALNIYNMGREVANNTGETDVLVHHGSTDAPIVDVDERTAGNLVDDAAYGDFAGYLSLPTADYTLDVKDQTGSVVVASYGAPLATLGLADSALTVVASGFLDPSANNNGPSFGLWVALPEGGELVPLPVVTGPTARIQVIHNSADLAADSVDVYLNGSLLLDNFAFRTATPFIDAPALTNIQIGVAGKNSTSVNDTIPGAVFNYNLAQDSTYILVADGIVSPTGYAPAQPFTLNVYGSGREVSSTIGNTDVLVHHGSTDAPTVDVDERTAGNLVDDASYGDFAGYLSLPTADYTLDVKDQTGSVVVASYGAPLSTLGLTDSAITVIASGFLDPSVNSNGEAFGLFVALPEGGNLIPLPSVAGPTARVQVIHNSADLAADSVDVYLNGSLLLDNFAFRTATPFIDAPALTNIQIGVAGKNSTSVNDTIPGAVFNYNLAQDSTYILVADGIVSPTGYAPAQPFTLNVYGSGREMAATSGNTDVLVHHGSTDAPIVDVDERSAGNLVDDAAYGDFAGYLSLATANYILDIKDSPGTTNVASYYAPLAALNLTDSALVVVASGFLDPSVNSNGPAFGLWVALPNGGNLIELPDTTGPTTSLVENTIEKVTMFPNPANDIISVDGYDLNNKTVAIFSADGKIIDGSFYTVNNSQINIAQLAKGTYRISILDNSKMVGVATFIKM